MRYVALLRGVNVGGRGKIAMADLRALCADLGYQHVETLLQSGNVVFTAKGSAATIQRALADAVADHMKADTKVMVRTGTQLASVIESNPLRRPPPDAKRFFVAFLDSKPRAPAVTALEAEKFGDERFWVAGTEVYALCPRGAADTKLTNALWEKRLGVAATMRNWNTVTKLAELTKGNG
jgi:uncharacterized protein (DUF1697 family)